MTNNTSPNISVGFPVYNEDATVGDVLREAHELLSASGLSYEILVCNDGSKDRSLEIISSLAAKYSHFRIINHPYNLGIRETFEHINREAKGDFVFINSTDKQWDTAILFDMLPLTKNADIIIASRKNKSYSLLRNIISMVFNAVPVILFGVKTYDAGAVKLVKKEVIRKFNLISKSPFSEAERLIRAQKAGYRIINFPVEVFPRRTGHSHGVRPRLILTALADVLRVWYSIFVEKKS